MGQRDDAPLPYVSAWPLPINFDTYRKAFEERPDIKRIFIKHNKRWLKAVSVDEFLALIDEFCKIRKFYKVKYEWNGSLIKDFHGRYNFSPISIGEICFDTMPDHFRIEYTKNTLREDKDGWPRCSRDSMYISSADNRKVCFDTSQDDMSSYYGPDGYIELLERIEDSPLYEEYSKTHPEIIKACRNNETKILRTVKQKHVSDAKTLKI